MIELFRAKFDSYVEDITTEVELLHDTGRLFIGARQNVRVFSTDQHSNRPDLAFDAGEEHCSSAENDHEPVSGQPLLLHDDGHEHQDDAALQTERMADCITDCFEEFCFVDKSFDLNKFASLSQ